MRKLKLCPFCGGEALLNERRGYYIYCSRAICHIGTDKYIRKQDAIISWNARAVDVDRIEKALRNIKIENTSADVKICGIKIWDRLIAKPTFNIDEKVYKQVAKAIVKELII